MKKGIRLKIKYIHKYERLITCITIPYMLMLILGVGCLFSVLLLYSYNFEIIDILESKGKT